MIAGTRWPMRGWSGALFLIAIFLVACGPLPDRRCSFPTKGGATCITVRYQTLPPVADAGAETKGAAE